MMTEDEWLRCTDPEPMLDHLYTSEPSRKMQLIAAACLRRIEHLLTDEGCRGAILAIECEAMDDADFRKAYDAAYGGWDRMASAAYDGNYSTALLRAMSSAGLAAWHAIDGDMQCVGEVADSVAAFAAPDKTPQWFAARQAESTTQSSIIREIMGNPFRSIAFSPTWRTSEVVAIARRAYENREFSSMPRLGSALAAVGCNNSHILEHCQQTSKHVRGCWVIDLVLDMKP